MLLNFVGHQNRRRKQQLEKAYREIADLNKKIAELECDAVYRSKELRRLANVERGFRDLRDHPWKHVAPAGDVSRFIRTLDAATQAQYLRGRWQDPQRFNTRYMKFVYYLAKMVRLYPKDRTYTP